MDNHKCSGTIYIRKYYQQDIRVIVGDSQKIIDTYKKEIEKKGASTIPTSSEDFNILAKMLYDWSNLCDNTVSKLISSSTCYSGVIISIEFDFAFSPQIILVDRHKIFYAGPIASSYIHISDNNDYNVYFCATLENTLKDYIKNEYIPKKELEWLEECSHKRWGKLDKNKPEKITSSDNKKGRKKLHTITEYKVASVFPSNNGKGAPWIFVPQTCNPPSGKITERLKTIPTNQITQSDGTKLSFDSTEDLWSEKFELTATEYMKQGWKKVNEFTIKENIITCNKNMECLCDRISDCRFHKMIEIDRLYTTLSYDKEIEIDD